MPLLSRSTSSHFHTISALLLPHFAAPKGATRMTWLRDPSPHQFIYKSQQGGQKASKSHTEESMLLASPEMLNMIPTNVLRINGNFNLLDLVEEILDYQNKDQN